MFYTHSSLVERAGRLDRNGATQTILPIIYAPAGDITAYLPTNVMSMTDGQWILDMNIFKDTMRPAVSTGLSVTRVGGVGQNKRQKALAAALNKTLAGYRVAEEYAHFGTELSPEAQADYDKGKALFLLMNQDIGEGYNLVEQQFLLDLILNAKPEEKVDIRKMKELVHEVAAQLKEDKELKGNYDQLRDGLKAQVVMIDEKIKADREKAEAEAVKKEAEMKAEAEEAAKSGAGAAKEGEKPAEGDKKADAKDDNKLESEKQVEKAAEKSAEAARDAKEDKDDKAEDKPAEKAEAKEPAEAKK
jgi:F0F1-type ATP synthase alpha subunit